MFMHYVEEFHPLEAVLWLRRLVADLSSRRPGFDRRPRHVRCVVVKVALGKFYSEHPVFPCVCTSTNAPYLSRSTCYSYKNEKRSKLGTFQNSALAEIGEHWIEM